MADKIAVREAKVTALYRYPVKGLSAEPMTLADLSIGETFAYDRAWAIENGPGRFDRAAPRHLPKICFLMLMRNERLATLESQFDEPSKTLTIRRGGQAVVTGDLTTRAGRAVIEQFFAAYMKDDLRGPPRVVDAPNHSFTDTRAKGVHIINIATLRELERTMGRPVSPLRFRPNIVVDGIKAWDEFGWIDRSIEVGAARLDVYARTDRCAATNVDPATGARDMDIPAQLARNWGHIDFGVYAKVSAGGIIRPGDTLKI